MTKLLIYLYSAKIEKEDETYLAYRLIVLDELIIHIEIVGLQNSLLHLPFLSAEKQINAIEQITSTL